LTTAPLFVHVPAQLLAARLPFLLNRKLQPEVACQEVRLDKLNLPELRDCAEQLSAAKLQTSLHAPFASFNPGSPKKRQQKKAHAIAELSLELADILNAGRIVFHPGLSSNPSAKEQQQWLQNSLNFWPDYICQAEALGTQICIENIFESTPELLQQLCQELESPAFGHCFDIGHWNMFATGSLTDWFAKLGRHTRHLHLHDNHGQFDEHLPVGQGVIDFTALFEQIKQLDPPPSMTLEAHSLPALEASLLALERYRPANG
jgi:sugar phosphate isomerase/epimerase